VGRKAAGPPPVLERNNPVKRILVPIDGTPNAEAALAALTAFCDPDDEVTLLKVEKPQAPQRSGYRPSAVVSDTVAATAGGLTRVATIDVPVYAETGDQAVQRQLDEAHDYLEGLADELRYKGFWVNTEVRIDEHPAKEIVDYARHMRPTFIAMLRRTSPTLKELIFGRVASTVMHADVAPVLFIPPAVEAA
jgi:nucleotide-binding universal stress UspA family protein